MQSHLLSSNDVLDRESYAMLRRNEMDSILSPRFIQHDDERELQYDTDGAHQASSYLGTHVFDRTQYIAVLLNFTNAFVEAHEYMLPETGLVGDLDYVYIDDKLGVHVPYVPIVGFVGNKGSLELLRSVEQLLEPDASVGDVDYAQTVRESLTKWKNFKLPEFKRILRSLTLQPDKHSVKRDRTSGQHVGIAGREDSPDRVLHDKIRSDEQSPIEQHRDQEVPNVTKSSDTRYDGMAIPGADNVWRLSDAKPEDKSPEQKTERKGLFDGFFARKTKEKSNAEKAQQISAFGKDANHDAVPIPAGESAAELHVHELGDNAQAVGVNSRESNDGLFTSATGAVGGMRPMVYTTAGDDDVSVVVGHEVKERTSTDGVRTPTTDYSGKQPVTVGAYLIHEKTATKHLISVTPFYVGRRRSEVDFFIPNNKLIGRIHICITFENGQFYLEDKGSVNHTHLDGKQLEPYVPVPLVSGDVIVLSQTETLLFCTD